MRISNYIMSLLNQLVADGDIQEAIYTYPAQFNNIAGRCKTPVGVLTLPDEWKLDCDSVTAIEHGTFHVYFLTTQTELDFDATQNESLIDDMIDVAVNLVGMLKNNPIVNVENIDINTQSMYDVNNKNLTGVHLKLQLREKQGRCIPVHGRC